MILTSIYKY